MKQLPIRSIQTLIMTEVYEYPHFKILCEKKAMIIIVHGQ